MGGKVNASATTAGRSQRFVLRKVDGTSGPIHSGDAIVLQTRDRLYLVPDVNGHGLLHAQRGTPGPTETFHFVDQDE